jgi:hypothetical protein
MHSCCMSDEEGEQLWCEVGISGSNVRRVRVGTTLIIDLQADCNANASCSQTSIIDFTETVAKVLDWTKDKLNEQIMHFVIETDQV